jgi:hypothetical protein
MPAGGEMANPTGRQEESLTKRKRDELGELQNQLKNCLKVLSSEMDPAEIRLIR